MNKFQRSWLLLRSSLSVVGRNKQLLVFPIVVFTCTLVIVPFFLAPPLLRPMDYSYVSAEHWEAISHSLFEASTVANGQQSSQATFTPPALA